jgi:hypothetical protein
MQLEMVQRKSKSMSLFVTMPNNSFLAGEEQAGPDKDLFLPVDILQK